MYIRWKTFVAIGLFAICFGIMRYNAFSSYVINIPIAVVYCVVLVLMYFKDYKGYWHSLKKTKKESPQQASDSQDAVADNKNDNQTLDK
jgi:hypothetical protein